MPRDSFVHLHLHTEYSLLDGSIRMKELMKKATEYKMPAVAMTVNGKAVTADVDPRTLLVQFLREHLRLTLADVTATQPSDNAD